MDNDIKQDGVITPNGSDEPVVDNTENSIDSDFNSENTGADISLKAEDEPTVSENDIVADLEQSEVEETKVEDVNEVNPINTLPFKMKDLSKDQIHELQDLLAITPRKQATKDRFHNANFRVYNGKVIVKFGTTYDKEVYDPILRANTVKTYIDILLQGEEKEIAIPYSTDFINTKRVKCKIVKIDHKENVKVTDNVAYEKDGEGNPTGITKEMVENSRTAIVTVELPDGEQLTTTDEYIN